MVPSARFDDLTPGHESAFLLQDHVGTVVARSLDAVQPAIEEVADAAKRGLWSAGFVSYEAAPAFDPRLGVRAMRYGGTTEDLPLVWFAIFEHRAAVPALQPRSSSPAGYNVSGWIPNVDAAQWVGEVSEIRERIDAGEVHQVNHTLRLRAAFAGDPRELYRDIALAQRGAHAAYLDTGRHQVASASPELFFGIGHRRIVTRPMKGTIHRGRWSTEDRGLAESLLASAKDQAENLMIVELLRDDLARIAVPGSVQADRLLQLERYETLWTLTSEVSAELPATAGLWDVFEAIFPSASVTGTPKVEAMRVIAELEEDPRGIYCGAIGYIAPGADFPEAQFNVAIRTVVVDADEGIAEYGVGGGVTRDSDPSVEYEEARTKARLLAQRRPEFDLVESIRWEPGTGLVLVDRHLARLRRSAEYFGFTFDGDHLRELLDKTVSSLDRPVRLRIRCGRCGAVAVELDDRLVTPFATTPKGFAVRVAIGEPTVDRDDVFLYHSTTRRGLYEAHRDAHPGATDVLLVNREGELIGSTVSNVVLRFGDRWWTPHLASGVLPGVFREELLDTGAIGERRILRDEVLEADEVALIDSTRGWRPVALFEPEI